VWCAPGVRRGLTGGKLRADRDGVVRGRG